MQIKGKGVPFRVALAGAIGAGLGILVAVRCPT